MYAFTLEQPTTLADALKQVAAGAQALAGGQTLLASMKLRLSDPGQLVDLAGIEELRSIKKEGNTLHIGSMARHAAVAEHVDVLKAFPALADLASRIGDRQVRAMGTIGGSIANHDPAACYPAAVLGSGATVVTDHREIAADDFFTGLFSTALEEGELITGFRFPIPEKAAYEKLRQKASHFPLVGVFVTKSANGVRVAVTGAGNGVFRHAGLEKALSESFTPEAAAKVTIDDGDLNSDLHASAAYRANLISVMTQRAVTRVLG